MKRAGMLRHPDTGFLWSPAMETKKANANSTVETKGRIATIRETDKHGRTTGHSFYRCEDCGAEVMTSWGRDGLDHAAGCPNSEADR